MPRCSFDFTQTSHQSSARELQAFSDASLGSSTIKFEWILNTRIVRPQHDFHVRRNRSSGTLKRRVKLKWQMSKMPRWKKFAHQKLWLALKCLKRWNLLLVKFQRFPAYQKPQKNYKHESSRSDSLDTWEAMWCTSKLHFAGEFAEIRRHTFVSERPLPGKWCCLYSSICRGILSFSPSSSVNCRV